MKFDHLQDTSRLYLPPASMPLQRALVIGGAGFIGSHVVELLVRNGIAVTVFDNFSTGHHENLAAVQYDIDIMDADLLDENALRDAMQGVDVVFHLAALTSVTASMTNASHTAMVNTFGTVKVLTAAVKANVRRVIFTSTCAVYGELAQLPIEEGMPTVPQSPYAASKLAAEVFMESFRKMYGLETVCLRLFNVFGERQSVHSAYAAAIPTFLECFQSGRRPKVYGDGFQIRDFIHVSDVARAHYFAATANDIHQHHIFNIGTGTGISIRDLLESISRQLNVSLPATFEPARAGDIQTSIADITLAQRHLEFAPLMDLDAGLKLMINTKALSVSH